MKPRLFRKRKRRGATLPLVAVTIVGMCGFVALAVDVGRVAVARVQVQSAADVAATAAARALNGVLPQNLSAASSTATSSLSNYTILGQPLPSSTAPRRRRRPRFLRVDEQRERPLEQRERPRLQVVQNLCNNADGTPGTPSGFTPFTPNQGYPGYATLAKPVQIQCIAFGAIFEVAGSTQNSSVSLLPVLSAISFTVSRKHLM